MIKMNPIIVENEFDAKAARKDQRNEKRRV